MTAFFGLLMQAWGNPIGRLVLIGAAAFFFGWVKGFSYGADDKAVAIAARDTYWQGELTKANDEQEAELDHAVEDSKAVKPLPAPVAGSVRKCPPRDPGCRSTP